MKGLAWRCAATIGWVVCLVALDRRFGWLAIGAPGYALAATAVALLVVPRLRRLSTLGLLAFAFPAFCALEVATGGPIDLRSAGGALLEFAGAAVTLLLASRLARRLALAEDALREFAVGPLRDVAEPFSRSQGEMFREVRRARRHERPLSLLAVSASGPQPPPALAQLLDQARREGLERYLAAKVAALLDEETAGSTVIAERGDHFLLLLPETGPDEAEQVARRLERAALDRHRIALRVGIASFPHPEVTFDKLLESAESGLHAALREARGREAGYAGGEPLASSTGSSG
jgi:hypothetical protein